MFSPETWKPPPENKDGSGLAFSGSILPTLDTVRSELLIDTL